MKLGDYIFEYSQRNKEDKSYPVYSVTNTLGFCQEYFSKDVSGKDKTTYKLVPRGYFAYNPSRINVGSVDWQKTEDCVIVSPLYVVFGLKDTLKPEYLKYYLKSKPTNELIRLSTSGTVRDNLKYSTLEKFPIPVPPIEEQNEICSLLDKMNRVIEAKKEQLKELDNLAQAIFYDMFGDPFKNEYGFPLETIDDVISFEGGSQPAKEYFEYEPSPNNIRLIQIRDYKTDDYITYIPKKLARKFCDETDIMIGRYGPPIFQILKGLRGAYNVALMKAVPNKGEKEFVRAFLKQECLLHYLEHYSRRVAGQDGIQMDKLKAFPFPYPPLPLQQAFAEKVKAIERQKELINQSINDVQTLFDAKMDYYFGE